MAERYGADVPVRDWCERLACSKCRIQAGLEQSHEAELAGRQAAAQAAADSPAHYAQTQQIISSMNRPTVHELCSDGLSGQHAELHDLVIIVSPVGVHFPAPPQQPHAFAGRALPFLRPTCGTELRAASGMIAEHLAARRAGGLLRAGLPGERRLDVTSEHGAELGKFGFRPSGHVNISSLSG
jgi:hypothetical protein